MASATRDPERQHVTACIGKASLWERYKADGARQRFVRFGSRTFVGSAIAGLVGVVAPIPASRQVTPQGNLQFRKERAMNTFSNRLPRTLRAGFVAVGLAFVCLPAASVQAAQPAGSSGPACQLGEGGLPHLTPLPKADSPADTFRVLAKQGGWTVASNGQDVIVSFQYEDGAKFSIWKNAAGYKLGFADQSLNTKEGQTFKVSVEIDGKRFSGEAKAVSSSLVIVDVDDAVMNQIIGARSVKFAVAGSDWTITPADAVSAIKAASTNS
jgi:hypothetical protein